ncbi:unnamed protein product [Cyclocybe aegerita]|uniref:Sphingolipid long chain base-responsive protein LSP1 n=1 Tax=Cyclocybe aegerita TaxID=1973307 RepID=A0A8S0W861_CYCAE|nr:unnamed protein product [Cyclocybe aegerita]
MPVPSFLTSFADKAQSAINASPLAAHLPSSHHARPSSPDPASQPPANEAAAQGGAKSHTLEALQYQFRTFQQQYSSTTPVQKIITTEKGIAIDFDSVARDSKSQSKELYTWGQSEAEDLKDVTDRLAYLNFVQGSLATSLSDKLDSARAPLKALRDAETALQPRRNIRAGLQGQIGRLEHEQAKTNDKRIFELREQLRKAEAEDLPQEREIEVLKRKAIRESEQIKWDAIREYGEKLVLLSQAAPAIIAALPAIPPLPSSPYLGGHTTGAVRASLQRALDNYKTGHINLPPQVAASDLTRSDTQSFGESHASELSSIQSSTTPSSAKPVALPTPLSSTKPLPASPVPGVHTNQSNSPPINPQALNQSPAPIPVPAPVSPVVSDPAKPTNTVPIITPTVAETGVPLSAGPTGPGPASGSLHDIKGASLDAGPRTGGLPAGESASLLYGQTSAFAAPAPVPHHPTAEEEKRRLAALYSQQAPGAVAGPPPSEPVPAPAAPASTEAPRHETAEEEKKRLEREERERVLHAGNAPPKDKDSKDEDLPPYQEPGL